MREGQWAVRRFCLPDSVSEPDPGGVSMHFLGEGGLGVAMQAIVWLLGALGENPFPPVHPG